MPVIRFTKNQRELNVASGANLMDELLLAGLPVASSCHGDGICGKCRIKIISGAENLTKQNSIEQLVRDRLKIAPEYRISCQVRVMGDVVVDTAYW